jgi:predicted nucleic acid-binding protein
VPDSDDIYLEWRRLVVTHGVSGKKAHDARLVAAMTVNGITHILTFNADDFAKYARHQRTTPRQALTDL